MEGVGRGSRRRGPEVAILEHARSQASSSTAISTSGSIVRSRPRRARFRRSARRALRCNSTARTESAGFITYTGRTTAQISESRGTAVHRVTDAGFGNDDRDPHHEATSEELTRSVLERVRAIKNGGASKETLPVFVERELKLRGFEPLHSMHVMTERRRRQPAMSFRSNSSANIPKPKRYQRMPRAGCCTPSACFAAAHSAGIFTKR